MKALSDALLEEVTRRLVSELQPEQVILFGSHAWGTPDDDSDLDVLVVVPESDKPRAELAFRARRCLRGLNLSKDIVVRTSAEIERFRNVRASLESEIVERGRLLYG